MGLEVVFFDRGSIGALRRLRLRGRQFGIKGQSQDVPVKSPDRQAFQYRMGTEEKAGSGIEFVAHLAKLDPIDAVANPMPGNGFMDEFVRHADALAWLQVRGKMVRLRAVEMPVTLIGGRAIPVPQVEPLAGTPDRRRDGRPVKERRKHRPYLRHGVSIRQKPGDEIGGAGGGFGNAEPGGGILARLPVLNCTRPAQLVRQPYKTRGWAQARRVGNPGRSLNDGDRGEPETTARFPGAPAADSRPRCRIASRQTFRRVPEMPPERSGGLAGLPVRGGAYVSGGAFPSSPPRYRSRSMSRCRLRAA